MPTKKKPHTLLALRRAARTAFAGAASVHVSNAGDETFAACAYEVKGRRCVVLEGYATADGARCALMTCLRALAATEPKGD